MAQDSAELAQIAAEARDIARQVSQEVSTAHLLLALFTVKNAADELLRERGCDEDKILAELTALGGPPGEPQESFPQALEKARQIADSCGSAQADSMHLLVALTRLSKSSAALLLEKTAAPLTSLRTTALSFLTGATPRRREVAQAVQPRGRDVRGRPGDRGGVRAE